LLGKNREIALHFCEDLYCLKCSKLKSNLFNEIGKDESVYYSCTHCRIAMPSLVKVLAKLSSFEEWIQKIERSLAVANQENPLSDGKNGKDVVMEVLQEEKQDEHELEI